MIVDILTNEVTYTIAINLHFHLLQHLVIQ